MDAGVQNGRQARRHGALEEDSRFDAGPRLTREPEEAATALGDLLQGIPARSDVVAEAGFDFVTTQRRRPEVL